MQELDRIRKQSEQDNIVKSGIRSEMLKLHTELEGAKLAQSDALQKVESLYNELQQERENRGRAVNRLSQLQKERDQFKSQYEQLLAQFELLKAEKTRINELPDVAIKLANHLEVFVQKFDGQLIRLEKLPVLLAPSVPPEQSKIVEPGAKTDLKEEQQPETENTQINQ